MFAPPYTKENYLILTLTGNRAVLQCGIKHLNTSSDCCTYLFEYDT